MDLTLPESVSFTLTGSRTIDVFQKPGRTLFTSTLRELDWIRLGKLENADP
jgi:hypothetical protein